MNSFFLIFIGLPVLEIFLMIKIGSKIGALNTIFMIFITAIIGIYFAKIEGIKTLQKGVSNLYENITPVYEMISGASIAFAALLLIIPGFLTDAVGFLILVPFTRKLLIKLLIKKKYRKTQYDKNKTLDGEIIEEKKDEL
tara:strand:+ start:2934 stop:3353 length:420 start_codon:yes stop_codon:yes gene_type:complete